MEIQNEKSNKDTSDRRAFLRRFAMLTAVASAGGLLAAQSAAKLVPKAEAADSDPLIIGNLNLGSTPGITTVLKADVHKDYALQVFNSSSSGYGILGSSGSGPGVVGGSVSGVGVQGISSYVGLFGEASGPTAIPIVSLGAVSQNANLQEWQSGSSTPLLAVDHSGNLIVDANGTNNGASETPGIQFGVPASGEGMTSNRTSASNGNQFGLDFWTGLTKRLSITNAGNVGIGTDSPQTTLQVKGGMSLALATKTKDYTMKTSDFAILANAGTSTITITLPPASKAGMMVHVKKIDSSSNVVTISRAGTDTIEGDTAKPLATQYKSMTLIADGSHTWYVLSSAT